MPVRSGVTVTDTSHLCQLKALMFLVCMQRATLKVITWSLVREQEVPLQQTLRLKVHRHRLDAVATVAGFFLNFYYLFFFFLPVVMWQRSLMHFLNFIFWISKFICKNCCRRKEICNHMLGSFYSRSVMWWSRPVRYTWRVDSSPQLCAASAETMTFKYTFFSNLAIPCIFFYQLIQTRRASVRSRDKTTNPSRYCALTRGKNGRAKKKNKNTCNPACPVVLHTFFHEGLSFSCAKILIQHSFLHKRAELRRWRVHTKLTWPSQILCPEAWITLMHHQFVWILQKFELPLKWNEKRRKSEQSSMQLVQCESGRVAVFRVFPCRLASDGHAQLPLGRGFLFCLPFHCERLFPAIPPLSADATFCHTGPGAFCCSPSQTPIPPSPLPLPCVTGFFLITDPSSCYYSNPLLYNMPFYMRFDKGPIWSEGYGARSWEMQLHGGNLCLGQNGGLTSSLLMHSLGHSGPSLTCWAHWIR